MNAEAPEGLLDAFWRYERALMADDVAELDALFAPGDRTLRADASGVLVGHEQIAAFRVGRGGAPRRTVAATHVRVVDDAHAWVLAETVLDRGGRGLQSQLWERGADGWRVAAAHVSVPPTALDTATWRVVGDPLVRPSARGPLDGHTVAVKDLFAVAGQPVGAGNPAWLATAPTEDAHAWAVGALLGAGASVRGISRTDEFAYSLAGENAHYGGPANPAAPGRLSGGSSSGSATAVAAGHATIGLGTDTGGSIRVPAAYQGLFGIRTSHGAVPASGLMPLAPSFDTVGWLTRDLATLRDVAGVLLPDTAPRQVSDVVVLSALLDRADPDVAASVASFAFGVLGAQLADDPLPELDAWADTFVVRQSVEAWQSHGWWLGSRMDTLGADVRSRFEAARARTGEEASRSLEDLAEARTAVRELVGDRVVVMPAAPGVAPLRGADLGVARAATLALTCLAGLGGLPVVCVPLATDGGLPCAAALVAAPGRDLDLVDLAASLVL